MKSLKMYMCHNLDCGYRWIGPIKAEGLFLKILNWFKIKRCPMCKRIIVDYTTTISTGPK